MAKTSEKIKVATFIVVSFPEENIPLDKPSVVKVSLKHSIDVIQYVYPLTLQEPLRMMVYFNKLQHLGICVYFT